MEDTHLGIFICFGTERARLCTFRGFGTKRARLGTLCQKFEIFTQNEAPTCSEILSFGRKSKSRTEYWDFEKKISTPNSTKFSNP